MEEIISSFKMNKFQTPITEELKNSLNREVWNDLLEYTSSVQFIKNLIAPENIRGYAKDKPKENEIYKDGRIDVDLTNPHILEDLDFFREKALFFERNGKYTNIPPNSNPKSEYALFWKEEVRRWKEGLVRPSDGEWIPGQLYFYWNYSPIWLVENEGEITSSGKRKGSRVRKFPKPWLGDYLFYHYMQKGRDNGKHGKLLKTRGVGFEQPDSELVLTNEGWKTVGDVKEFDKLIGKDGNPVEVLEVQKQGIKDVYELEFTDGRKVKCGLNHLWVLEYKGKEKLYNTKKLLNLKLSNYINSKKYFKYYYAIPKINPINYNEKLQHIKPYTLGILIGDGNLNHSETRFSTTDLEIINYIQEEIGDLYEIVKHNTKYSYGIKSKIKGINKITRELKRLNLNCKSYNKYIPSSYLYGSINQRLELLRGLMDSDGSISSNGTISFTTSSQILKENFLELARSLGIKCTVRETNLFKNKNTFNKIQTWQITLSTKLEIFKLKRKKDRLKNKKFINDKVYLKSITKLDYQEESTCFLINSKDHLYLTKDFIPTHNSFKMGSISPCNMYTLTGSGNPNFHLASDKSFLSGDKAIWGKVLDTLDWIAETTPLPRMRLVDKRQQVLELQLGVQDEYGVRKGLLSSVHGISLKDNPDKARGIRGPLIHYEEDGLFPNLEKAWGVNRKAVEDGNTAFGYMLAGGTGGTEGASFEGSEKLFYNPGGYNIYGIPNVYDKNTNGETLCGFFWGAYLNRKDCYNEELGEPDVIKALIEILQDRFEVKYSSTDSSAITQKKAEEPITPQEAVMRTEGTVFPVADLKEYLESIAPKKESFLAEHYVGDLIYNNSGQVEWRPNSDIYPIRSYDNVPDNKSGAVEIFEMPRKNANGEIPRGRYIAGIDPIDADTGTSLFSVMVMDLFTDRIVAEYTGRPRLAVDAYETTLRLLKFYNAEANYEKNLKGLFSYFDSKNALHYLCDTPQILKDMDMVKATNLYGNQAKGTGANKEVNKYGRVEQAQWMLTKAYGDEEDERLNLHRLRSLAYIEECIKWNADGNFDRVSAAGMLFILRADRYKRTLTAKENQDKKIESLANDKFWNKNYKPNRGISYN